HPPLDRAELDPPVTRLSLATNPLWSCAGGRERREHHRWRDAMKLVTFAVSTPVGRMTRLGALVDGHEQGRVADLTAAYAAYLAAETDESRPREIAAVRTPPDMIGWLDGGRQSLEAAEQAMAYAR